MKNLKERIEFSSMSLLHLAPERIFRGTFSQWFGDYTTADLKAPDVDHHVDLTCLPFTDDSYDVVYASHVLEHIRDDKKAISEIRRILRPGGFAVLPVPLVSEKTIEYPAPNPHEAYHVRAPGLDYFDRYRECFARIEEFSSEDFPPEYQLYTYEDRSGWPTENMPLRQKMDGERHIDVVPVCFCDT
jgi:predicted SAM-dependent methyltransferase